MMQEAWEYEEHYCQKKLSQVCLISNFKKVKFMVTVKIEKKTKRSHNKVQHLTITRVLELLHMDLMGTMHVGSLGEKRYVFVYDNNYSRYTWFEFIHRKYDFSVVFEALCHHLQREKGE